MTLRNAIIYSAILFLALAAGSFFMKPKEKIIYQTKTVTKRVEVPGPIQWRDRDVPREVIIYRSPDDSTAPVDSKAICKGSRPVRIIKIDVTKDKDSDKERKTSWLIVKPIGSNVHVTCAVAGDMNGFWEVNMVINIVQGEAW